MTVKDKINNFFKASLTYFDSEIILPTNQHFSIDEVVDEDNSQDDEVSYVIQYGFSNSGGIILEFTYSDTDRSFYIDRVKVFAPPAGEDILMAVYSQDIEVENVGISVRIGIKTGVVEHTSLKAIESNPNALKMLDIATYDLIRARVVGEFPNNALNTNSNISHCRSKRIEYENGKTF